MELLQLKYFKHAAKTENFSKTAKEFTVPTSGVSASIKKLEDELGVKLFERTANKIKLNESGKILLQAIDKSNEILKKAKSDILDLKHSPCGELKLLILANRQKITDAISEFKIKYPQISLKIKHNYQFSTSDINKYDIVVADESIDTEYFDKQFWLHEEIYIAVHKNHHLAKKKSISPNELKYEKFISMPETSSLRNQTDNYLAQYDIIPDIVIECDDPQYIHKYLKLGLGITFFPSVSWKTQITDDIAMLKINDGLYRNCYIYTNRTSQNIAQLFSQMLIKK